ncbi:MAG: DsrE family protein [Bacteroidota bacterium]
MNKRRLLLVCLTLVVVTLPLLGQVNPKKSLFVNLTSDEVSRATMAISVAHRVLTEKKIPVTIWLNVDGVRLVDKDLIQNMYGDARTPLEKLQTFMFDGGKVLICPMCLKNVGGMEKSDIPKGVELSDMDIFWTTLFADDVRVLSY